MSAELINIQYSSDVIVIDDVAELVTEEHVTTLEPADGVTLNITNINDDPGSANYTDDLLLLYNLAKTI